MPSVTLKPISYSNSMGGVGNGDFSVQTNPAGLFTAPR